MDTYERPTPKQQTTALSNHHRMSLAYSLLAELLNRGNQPTVASPSQRSQFTDSPSHPSSGDLLNHVDQVVTRTDTQRSARLDQSISGSQTLSTGNRARMKEILAANTGFTQAPLDLTAVDLKTPITQAPFNERPLMLGISDSFRQGVKDRVM